MTTEQGYNGWKNYETWNVALWLDNDHGTYDLMREYTADVAGKDADEYGVAAEDVPAWRRGDLADTIKGFVEELPEISDVTENASMVSDLLSAALSEVDWHEIADHYLSAD